MVAIARVRSIWTGPQIVGGGLTDLYFFGSSGDEDDMKTAVRDFWDDVKAGVAASNSVQVEPDVYNIDDASGDVISITSLGGTPAVVTGTGSGDVLPPATQGLVQWRTGAIVTNRVVRGRTFIPAQVEGASTAGGPDSGLMSSYQAAADALIAVAPAELRIWHRPVSGAGGSSHEVTSASIWNKWAVLRSRRD